MASAKKSADKPDAKLQGYLDAISKYELAFEKWEKRVGNIIKRYRDDGREGAEIRSAGAKFNILWSNVQTLVPACFARVPQPDVSRRFRDQDPVGRVSGMLLERGLNYEVDHYPDYRETVTQCVHDRFLGGRGTCWVRYEPHFKAGERAPPPDGAQITEDVENEVLEEQIDYECAPVDYVHWKDFGHSVARTWEEVTLVWRKVYMSEAAVTERFGDEIAKKVPYDATPDDLKNANRGSQSEVKQQACIIELWDKEEGEASWLSKSMKEIIETRADPLKLQQFFPTPKPLYATLTNETLVPVPDFSLYQDQAYTLDTLADRASGLVEMLQLKGTHDAATPELGRLFTEGANGKLLPVKNWAGYSEKGGLKGTIDVLDLTPIAKALEAVYLAAEQQKQQVYEIMGISDIVRGSSDPNETLGAQELKGQYASMRLRSMQAEVARFATDVLQIKAQVMCAKFNPETLLAISAADQLSDIDKQSVIPALTLLVGEERMQDPEADGPNPLRSFRIEVNADSMIQMNEMQEKQDRMEFLNATGVFLEKALPVLQMAPAAGPIVLELFKFGITGFKVGKQIEGKLDEAIDKMMQAAMNPQPPPPDPAVMKAQAEIEQTKKEGEITIAVKSKEAELDERKMQREEQHDATEMAMEGQQMQQENAFKQQENAMNAQASQQQHAQTMQQQDEAGKMKSQQMAAQHAQKLKQAKQQPSARKQ